MGRAFEKRKTQKMARWSQISKAFTRIGKEIAMSVKQGGPDPVSNPRLRMAMQNAKAANMPKEKVENAIKKASNKEEKDFDEVVYEGYGPYGVAILVECATDNPTRTVANVRSYFKKHDGELGKTGSLDFLFERQGVFTLNKGNLDPEELELELIDFGAEEVDVDGEEIYIYTAFSDFGTMQKAIEDKGIELIKAELQRFPTTTVTVTEEQEEQINKLLEKLEEDDDVQQVFHNMA
ncbi:YebC/PmpR family DNA-binding transcriptional regulator [Sphingobacteriales bacterium UPWRP_1]|nr:YebC/PmpR family DNA-binding transcriptional regulator [Sphingobacteriales bacterium TSM_CSS]PSJ73103.1 YebC/PmpR family DNA-binding transcriptional regulator [Sphingobacteriales bacterium UPWRP_1]